MTDYSPPTPPPTVQRIIDFAAKLGRKLTYIGALPPDDTTWAMPKEVAHPTRRRTRNPLWETRGRAARIWAHLVELLLERSSPLRLGGDRRLRPVDAKYFATRSVWPTNTMHEAFAYLIQRRYVQIKNVEGHYVAVVALNPLVKVLRAEREIERKHPEATAQYAVLRYFRGRRFVMQPPPRWLDGLLQQVDQEQGER